MRVHNKHTAPLGLPGQSAAIVSVELQPGANDVDDAVWAKASASPMVQKWAELGLVIVETPVEAPKPRKA